MAAGAQFSMVAKVVSILLAITVVGYFVLGSHRAANPPAPTKATVSPTSTADPTPVQSPTPAAKAIPSVKPKAPVANTAVRDPAKQSQIKESETPTKTTKESSPARPIDMAGPGNSIRPKAVFMHTSKSGIIRPPDLLDELQGPAKKSDPRPEDGTGPAVR